ncbi:MAG TPA: zf-HC2 domain-containing protein [Candidatus Dormibacteraeota bacterium]|jgi:anti-sigma factor RsiW|nr:zf-HC2 domain-containing protein [Candidatus Dormibacteraeota bacterium]
MGARHVDELFSAAYDDALDAAERRRYDQHLGDCEQCATAAAEFRVAMAAVRALPAAQMPVRVVLPATPPVAERGRLGRGLAGMPALVRSRMTPAVGASLMGLAGVAAVVLVVHGHGGGPSANATSAASAPNAQFGAAGGAAAGALPAVHVGTCPLPLAVTTAKPGTSGTPPGFANRVSVATPQRPGQELVLATTGNHYAPGSQVLVYAALTTSSGSHAAVVPCVSMHTLGAVAVVPGRLGDSPAAAGAAAPGATGGGVSADMGGGSASSVSPVTREALTPQQAAAFAPYAVLQPLAVAQPTSSASGSLPVQVIQIPAGVARGTVLRLIALVPSGLPGSGDSPAIEAVLTIDVS